MERKGIKTDSVGEKTNRKKKSRGEEDVLRNKTRNKRRKENNKIERETKERKG